MAWAACRDFNVRIISLWGRKTTTNGLFYQSTVWFKTYKQRRQYQRRLSLASVTIAPQLKALLCEDFLPGVVVIAVEELKGTQA